MVGDTNLDIMMGKNANVKTVAVTWGAENRESLEKANPDYVIDNSFSNILPLIEKEFPL